MTKFQVAEHILTPEEKEKANKYFHHIYLDNQGKSYQIKNKNREYLASTRSLTEALYYRDLYFNTSAADAPRPKDVNLRKDNPYIKNGLKYPVPERLRKGEPRKKNRYGEGSILKKSKSSYGIYYNNNYICSCRTYEQAYFYRQQLVKYNWDTMFLPLIEAEYAEWYTELLYFYHYIGRGANGWFVQFPRKYAPDKQDKIYYTRLEDALYERDFLMKHKWDYELLVLTINDDENPYYNMILPPYPERKIRNIRNRKTHEKEILEMIHIIKEDVNISQKEMSMKLNCTSQTIYTWLRQYGTNWMDFKTLILSGKDPFTELQLKKIIYEPNLEPSKPCKNFRNYIYCDPSRKKKYRVQRKIDGKSITYGSYETRKIANKIVKELIRVDWDKKELPRIQEKYTGPRKINPHRFIYKRGENKYEIRRKMKGKNLFFGQYKTLELALRVRELLEKHDWDKKLVPDFRLQATKELEKKGV